MTAMISPDSVQVCSFSSHASVVSWVGSMMESTESTPQKSTSKQACDNCRRRKIKCNREYPCDKCLRLLLSCSYTDVLQRKGPKFRTLYPLAPVHPLSSTFQSGYEAGSSSQVGLDPVYEGQPGSTPSRWLGFYESQSSPDSGTSRSHRESSPRDKANRPAARRLSSSFILAHVNVFMKYLSPIIPVIRFDQIVDDCSHPETLSPQRYAFVAALCAATHFQLNLDSQNDAQNSTLGCCVMAGEEVLAEAIAARKEFDMFVNPDLDTLLTSFFLFASYGHLDHQDHAYFYLSQCTAIVHTLGLHRESTYALFERTDAEERRRIFWFLFITERAYALQQAKPVMLRSSIHKPKVPQAENPITEYCFLNLINLFEKLTVDLYDWVSTGCDNTFFKAAPTSLVQGNLAVPVTLVGVSEIQQVDILITQHWLQAIVWKISMNQNRQLGSIEHRMPFHVPFIIGRKILDVVSTVSQSAVDAQGIGMEQKLYDMGSFLPEVNFALNPSTTPEVITTIVDPKELLWGILNILSKIRATQTYLIPALLQQSGGLFHMGSPPSLSNQLNMPSQTSPDPNTSGNSSGISWNQGPMRQVEDIVDETSGRQRHGNINAPNIQALRRRQSPHSYGQRHRMYMNYPE